jgi:UPF0755 protein
MKTLARIIAAVLGATAALAAVFLYMNSSPPPRSAGERLFSITKGETLSIIARRLQEGGFIRFAPLMRLLSRMRGTEASFKAGYYRLPSGATTLAVHKLLVYGTETLERITIPEGWTIRKIAQFLETKEICPAEDFIVISNSPTLATKLGIPAQSLEGYLFPDTYLLPKPFPPDTLAEMMVNTFFSRLVEIAPESGQMDRKKIHDKVILASIVEREYRQADEAPLIASVFVNRLALNIGLEENSTLEYIITEIQHKAHPEHITLEDTKIDSPYNTYKWAGLPPGPISDPGGVALDAAFHPAHTDYLYFVLRDPDAGRHYFSRNLQEHNEAKYLYLKK